MDPIVERWYARQIPGERCWTVRRVAYHPSHQEVIIPSTTERVARHVVALQNDFVERMANAMDHTEHAGGFLSTLQEVLHHPEVRDAANQVMAAGIPWAQIIAVVIPIVLQVLGGQPINIQAVIAAILALINPPAPPPAK